MKIVDRGSYPLALNSKSELLFFRKGNLYLSKIEKSEKPSFLTIMPYYVHRIISHSRLIERILRNNPGPGISLGDYNFIYHYRSNIYRLDLLEKKVYLELQLPSPKKVLYFTKNICTDTGKECIYFGEYFENKSKEPVNVWKRDSIGQWRVFSTFPANSIEHVHNIAVDSARARLLILTGDFGESSGIWTLDHEGKAPVRLIGGSQMYRAAWMHVDASRLLYATDTPFEKNYLIEINLKSAVLTPRKLHHLQGSSIYGGALRNGMIYFSTSVEPIALTGNRWIDVFQRRRGVGIVDNKSYLYRYTLATDSLEIVLSDVKDVVPMRLGQYGSFLLSDALSNSSQVLAYGLALRNHDTVLLEL